MNLNLHHLELFYYVAKAGGIGRACQLIPYGIQQPAVSSQILKLEKDLGVSLFHRKPFQLTPSGRHLYEYLHPFFGGLESLDKVLRGELAQELRLAGIGQFLMDHMPDLLISLKRKFPNLKARLYERNQAEALELLERGDVDLAITVRESFVPPSIQSREIVRLPMVLLVGPFHGKVTKAEPLLSKQIETPLIALPGRELLTREFTTELLQRGGNWPITIEASSVDLVANYVARGMGVGLSVRVPQGRLPKGVRILPLHDFPEIIIAAFWRKSLNKPCEIFLDLLMERARKLTQRSTASHSKTSVTKSRL